MKVGHSILIFLFVLLVHEGVFANVVYDGYTDKRSYDPGDTVHVFISGNGTYTNAYVHLWNVNNVVVDSVTANIVPQSATGIDVWENGFGYSQSFIYVVPTTLHSGVYSWENNAFFIIKSATKNAAITLIYPTNTDEAYNPAGTKSLYDFNSSGGRAHIVSFHRPYGNWEIQAVRNFNTGLLQWMNTALSTYDYQMIADIDMDNYSEIQNSRILVIVGHGEYWTRDARVNFDQFVDSGKDAMILSGNTMWWQVRYSSDKTQLICYKDSALDPEPNTLLKTIYWSKPSLQFPILNSVGADWPHGAYANHSYHGSFGYQVLMPNSPLLNGTGLAYHSTISCQANEDDATLFYGIDPNGDPILDTTTLGFCKIELIAYDWGESMTYPNAPLRGYSTLIAFRKTPTSGNIINVGNSNWCGIPTGAATGGFGGTSIPIIKTITQNMFDLLLAGSNIYSTPGGCVLMSTSTQLPEACKIFPNPSSGELFIHFGEIPHGEQYFRVYGAMGQLVRSIPMTNALEQQVDLSGLADGIYSYQIQRDDKIILRGKLILTW